nr:unnamed protein product [Digitaria exilis]
MVVMLKRWREGGEAWSRSAATDGAFLFFSRTDTDGGRLVADPRIHRPPHPRLALAGCREREGRPAGDKVAAAKAKAKDDPSSAPCPTLLCLLIRAKPKPGLQRSESRGRKAYWRAAVHGNGMKPGCIISAASSRGRQAWNALQCCGAGHGMVSLL